MTYSEKFKDPRWQRKRLEILKRDDFHCRFCYDGENTLHAHHRYYITGRDPWDYPDWAIITLCDSCHTHEHGKGTLEESPWESVITDRIAAAFEHLISDLNCEPHEISPLLDQFLHELIHKVHDGKNWWKNHEQPTQPTAV